MPWLGAISEELITSAIGKIIYPFCCNYHYIKLRIYKPDLDVRVAFSAILRIVKGDQYLLVRNLHRPETFGPFGGVIKYYENAIPVLDHLDYRPHSIGINEDTTNDLRGFLPRKNLGKLVAWYDKREERESYSECLLRELKEEIAEAGLSKEITFPERLNFRFVRKIIEKPEYLKIISCYQYRVFEVYEIYPIQKECEDLLNKLFILAQSSRNVIRVSQSEIIRGRANRGDLVAPHTTYFFNHKKYRPDDPIFIRSAIDNA
jgi:SMODS-associated NUDIX domain